jgi:hypothetical protein
VLESLSIRREEARSLNPTNVTVPSLPSTSDAEYCDDLVADSAEPTSATATQAVAKAAGLEAATDPPTGSLPRGMIPSAGPETRA